MELFERILDTFAKKINYVRKASMGVPKTFVINLAVPLLDQPYHISGNLYYIWSSPNETDYIDIKVNKSSEPPLRCVRQTGLMTPFDKLLITTPAGQTGDMVLLYGTESPELLEIIDNRAAVVAGVDDMLTINRDILAQLKGDTIHENFTGITVTAAPGATLVLPGNSDRKSFSIQTLSSNTGSVFLGFTDTVTVGGAPGIWWCELQAGRSCDGDDYRGNIYGIATAAQIVGYGEV